MGTAFAHNRVTALKEYLALFKLRDTFIIQNLKEWIIDKRIGINNEIVAQINDYFEYVDKSDQLERVKQLEKHWTNFMLLKEGYFEKQNNFLSKNLFFIQTVTNLLTSSLICRK